MSRLLLNNNDAAGAVVRLLLAPDDGGGSGGAAVNDGGAAQDAGEETIAGGAADDTLAGAEETIAGGAADDTLRGAAGGSAGSTGAPPAQADPSPIEVKDFSQELGAAQRQYAEGEQELAAVQGEIDKLADDDIPTAGMIKRQQAAQRKMTAAQRLYGNAYQNQQSQQEQLNARARQEWSARNPDITLARADEVYQECYGTLSRKYPQANPAALQVAAGEAFERQLAAIRAGRQGRKPAAAAAAGAGAGRPPVSRGGGTIIPVGAAGARPPAGKPLSAAEKLLREFGQPDKIFGHA